MKKILLIFLSFCALSVIAASWQTDILGDGYEMRYVDQGNDYSGNVRSTIIKKNAPCGHDKGILYVHGYNDYFFQKEMGDRFVDSCINFYAVDLRKYGRSILPGQKKFEVRDLHEYYADIDSAIAQMHNDGIKEIVLMGHSTGGLITSLYMHDHNNSDIIGLILNSPFLDWNFKGLMKNIAIPAFGALGKIFPNLSISQGDSNGYQQSLLKQYHGEWDYNQDWKVFRPEKVSASWTRAISSAQKKLKHGGGIDVPVLLMHSSGSIDEDKWTPDFQHNDAVLNVEDIFRIGRNLGTDVTEETIDGGMHDLILSAPTVRENVYNKMFEWLNEKHIFK